MTRRRIIAAVLTVTVIAGLALTRLHDDDPTPDRSGQRPNTEPVVGGTREAATNAAIHFATAPQGWLHESDEAIRADIEQLAVPHARDDLAAAALEEVATARASLAASPGPVWWLVRPLAWRVDSFTGTRAEVAVWLVRILSAVEVAAPQSTYVTVTLSLEWSGGDWQLAAVTETPGPTPRGAPAGDQLDDAASFDKALRGFTRVGSEG
jgi:hypothetical protein